MENFLSIHEILLDKIKKNKTILYIGQDSELIAEKSQPESYASLDEDSFMNMSSGKYSYIILNEILETSANPKALIEKASTLAKTVFVVEQKYDVPGLIKSHWQQPWLKQGLEWILNNNFDYINSLYLMYQTIHTCEMPIPLEEKNAD